MRVENPVRRTIFGFKKSFVVQRFNTKVSNDGTSAHKGLDRLFFEPPPRLLAYTDVLNLPFYLIPLVNCKD